VQFKEKKDLKNKRSNLFKEYQNEIEILNKKDEEIVLSNSKINTKLFNQINAVDKNILTGLAPIQIELPEVLSNSDVFYDIDFLQIKVNLINNFEVDKIIYNHSLNSYISSLQTYINEDGNVNEDFVINEKVKNYFSLLDFKIENLESKIQNFPKTASNDLMKLNSIISQINKEDEIIELNDVQPLTNCKSHGLKGTFIFLFTTMTLLFIPMILIGILLILKIN